MAGSILCFSQKKTPVNFKNVQGAKLNSVTASPILENTEAEDCDTVSTIPNGANLTIYSVTEGGGFVCGTNAYNDKEKANYFALSLPFAPYKYITGAWIYFARGNSNIPANMGKEVIFKVYGDNGGKPGDQIGESASLSLSTIYNDIVAENLTTIFFPNPIPMPSSRKFYFSVDISNFAWVVDGDQDSIALVSTQAGSPNPGTGWEKWEDDTWNKMDGAWGNFKVALAVLPFISKTLTGCEAVVPINLISFDGQLKNNSVQLNWKTSSEINNNGFDVERSIDGKNFSAIGFVPGKGSSAVENAYTYSDFTKQSGTVYYRLNQKDFDGASKHSNVIKLMVSNDFTWQVYPNPLADNSAIQIQLPQQSKVSVQVVSMDGKLLRSIDKGTLNQGTYTIPLNMISAAKGSYLVKLVVDGKTFTKTIIK